MSGHVRTISGVEVWMWETKAVCSPGCGLLAWPGPSPDPVGGVCRGWAEVAVPPLNSLPTSFLSSAAVVDPDGRIYIRNWQGGILSGGFEKNPKPLFTEGRNQLEIHNLQEDWDHFGTWWGAESCSSTARGFCRRQTWQP